ncbi:Uncharacterised protein [Mycobacteroides abscessus subsp. bolletii]|uniref:Uncharacterized protein n=1 Tax=Mycobacteroides abscessus subsp. bolletii TaxID=319705 RepID=A0A9Q7SES7_9MYCO|nr:hypothetical protein [Mycobacteroides abscessus]QST90061.1 hypothetical protein PROPHIGD91-3_58 [Mycobacterium phage prophi91-3]QSM88808.1 hypothetical protein I3U44_24240 [Mycobacteroides abscessus subsp. bolletii]SHT86529.1 Uncharacterised protein [Mycobacteroides abscessus subsp. bolletii]SHU01708.1 Uncharacterised protein [Mycobacteroides abscessus subsp. bolletii]SHX43511.1 Uncharacterised protein [Mycobacteroides abscessus subsp. bolletii]
MDVQTDHQIVGFGPNIMQLFNSADGKVIVTAERSDPESAWTIKADGAADTTATDRGAAIGAMVDMALEVGPATGYSTLVPHGLAEQP